MATSSSFAVIASSCCLMLMPLPFIISWVADGLGSYQQFKVIWDINDTSSGTYDCHCTYNSIYCDGQNASMFTDSCTLRKNSTDNNASTFANTIIIATSLLIPLLFLYSWKHAVLLFHRDKYTNLKPIYAGAARTQCTGIIFGALYIIIYTLFNHTNTTNTVCVIHHSDGISCNVTSTSSSWFYVDDSAHDGQSLQLWLSYGIMSVALSCFSFIFMCISAVYYTNPYTAIPPLLQDSNTSNKFKILTWNMYSIFLSPYCFSNPSKCANFLLNLGDKEQWTEFDGLILCGVQEIWAWPTGLFPNIILTHFVAYCEYIPFHVGFAISLMFQLVSLIFGLLCKCLPLSHNPKQSFCQVLNGYLPYHYYDSNIPLCQRVMDSGLLLLTNKKATRSGFVAYVHCACADSMGNKGFVWAYFDVYNLLAINTHLQYSKSGEHTIAQINELKTFIDSFGDVNIAVFGDFNVDLTNDVNDKHQSFMLVCDIPQMLGHGMKKINSYDPTMAKEKNKKWGCLDHIFVNFEVSNLIENMYEDEHNSDHLLISNTFHRESKTNL
eukprot:664531_1